MESTLNLKTRLSSLTESRARRRTSVYLCYLGHAFTNLVVIAREAAGWSSLRMTVLRGRT